ncbi:hypothetical protein [Nakamurella multipartita]|nr:hypothetical protein [Nakamurella multipartita]
MTAIHRLAMAPLTSKSARRWRSVDLLEASRRVVSGVIGVGAALPLTRFAGALGFPVVEWRWESLAIRSNQAFECLLNPVQVRDVLADPAWSMSCPPALSVVGFIGVAPLRESRAELAGLRSMGRTVALTPGRSAIPPLTLADFDLQGTAVVSVEDEVVILVGGDPGVRKGTEMSIVWQRFYEEQLFDWAMRTDSLPALSALPHPMHQGNSGSSI